MLFDEAHTEELKAWLAAELGPICDADPEVLSDYVLALLKHDASEAELQKLLREQLEDFLAAETDKFVNSTFAALASKAYLPTTSNADVGAGASTSAAAASESAGTSRKRGADDDPERSSPPRQTRRLDDAPSSSGQKAGGRPAIYDEPLEPRGPRSRGDAPSGPRDGANGPRKQICRDFHNKGYCPRGASCKFDHSVNMMPGMPMAPQFGMGPMMGPGGPMGQMRPPPHHMVQGGPMMFPGGPGFGMPPQGWGGPNMPRPPQGMHNGSASPHGANGDAGLAARLGGQAPSSPHAPSDAGAMAGTDGAMDGSAPFGMPPQMMAGGGPPGGGGGGGRGGFAGRGGRGRGGGGPGHFASQRRSNTTLVIENVPAEHLDLIKVNEYFKKFGTITNISIDVPGTKALVSYSQPAEAKAAHESPDVIFGNRFVKVYFQRLDEPAAGAGPAAAAAAGQPQQVRPAYQPAPPKSSFGPGQNVYHARPPAGGAAGAPGASEERKKLLEDQRQKQAQLDAQLAEQKAMLGKLSDTSVPAEERKAAMASLRKLGEDIKASTDAVKAAVAALAAAPLSSAGAGAGGGGVGGGGKEAQDWKEQKEKREKEQLDRELDLHSKGASAGSTTEELRKKLESLQAEAAALGIDANGASSSSSSGGFQPRGRGGWSGGAGYVPRGGRGFAGYGRGRGGGGAAAALPNRGSMRLDNRTTKVKVSDLPAGADREKVQQHLKQFGEVESISDDGADGLTVVYKTRASGEQAMRSTTEIPEVGTLKLSWIPTSSASTTSTVVASAAAGGEGTSANEPSALPTPSVVDPAAAGGGEYEEDEDEDRDSSWKR